MVVTSNSYGHIEIRQMLSIDRELHDNDATLEYALGSWFCKGTLTEVERFKLNQILYPKQVSYAPY
jgi:hypothetical protein